MDKLKMQTQDIADENIKKIAKLFPSVITEGEIGKTQDGKPIIGKVVDFDMLEQLLSKQVVTVKGDQDRYVMNWPQKREFIRKAQIPSSDTLRLDTQGSVGKDGTAGSLDSGNLYIEGDNHDVLRVLRETYRGKVKMIYIDPPYNTGKDFIYKDDRRMTLDEYAKIGGEFDADGNALDDDGLVINAKSNPQFHTDWLNMMYPRLWLASDLLTDDGVIFISIDDNEVHNLRKSCDEIFGAGNFVGEIPRLSSAQRPAQEKYFAKTNDSIIVYAKDKQYDFNRVIERDLTNIKTNLIGRYFEGDTSPILASSTQGYSKGGDYNFEYKGIKYQPIDSNGVRRRWLWTIDRMRAAAELGILVQTKNTLRVQNYIDREFQVGTNIMAMKDANLILTTNDLMNSRFVNTIATSEIDDLGLTGVFDFPKPVSLMTVLVKLATTKDSIILDFFSGSATTAHALMQLNAEDGGQRKFIMVQVPQEIDPKHEGYKFLQSINKPTVITEIAKERIKRAGKKIGKGDIGFRLYRLDSTNMQPVYYTPQEYIDNLTLLDSTVDNIKPDRKPIDLLVQVMLELGIMLDTSIEQKTIAGKTVYAVNGDYLLACFDDNITDAVVTAVAEKKSVYAVFKNSGMSKDSVGVNFEQIFARISPNTDRRFL